MASGWVLPTGYNDPDSKWTYETTAYDGDTETHATTSLPITATSWSTFLEFTRASTSCSKLRFYCLVWYYYGANTQIDLDAYYGGTWNHVYQGVYTRTVWTEKSLGATYDVTKVRIRLYNPDSNVRHVCIREINLYYTKVPTVTTQAVSSVGSVTATGNGNITALGSDTPTKRGVCYNITGSPTVADDKVEEEGSFSTGAFTSAMTGLSPGVKYYVKAYAYNAAGYSYGAEVNFTTDKVAPTVTTQDPTDVLTTSITGNGNITASGGENATRRGFQYGLTQTDTWDVYDDGDFGTGAFTKAITTDLLPNTEYWIRAYATNSIGTSYGAWVQFQTAASGSVPTGTEISICSNYSGGTYILNKSLTDDEVTYTSYFIISTDLMEKQGLHFKKLLLDLFSYFENKASGTCKIYVKRDNETTWQYAGQISMVGDEDIIVKHLPSENQDSSGDVEFLAKHYLIKFVFENDFDFIGLVTESVLIGTR